MLVKQETLKKKRGYPLTRFFLRDGASGELKYTLEGHAMGIISVDVSVDGTRKFYENTVKTEFFLTYKRFGFHIG